MKKTVTISVLKSMLSKGNVKFTYKKKNGETREAIGTTNKRALDRIGIEFKNNDSNPDKSKSVVCYYDIEKNEWRSLSIKYNNTVIAEEI